MKRLATYHGGFRSVLLLIDEAAGALFGGAWATPALEGPAMHDLVSFNRKDTPGKKRNKKSAESMKNGPGKSTAPESSEEDHEGQQGTEDDLLDDAEDSEKEEDKREWPSSPGAEDLESIERFLQGDKEPFNRLVLKYQNRVFNLCYRFLGDPDEAEDMAQEVFMTVHKSLKKFRGDSLFSTWLFRITVNHCKNRLKFLGRRRYYQSVSMDQPQETEEGDLYHEVEDESPDPESTLSSQETQQLVQDAISKLDPEHRLVIVLRDIEDMSYEEIADMLDIKVGTVKSRIHRGRSELKTLLDRKM